MSDRHESRGRLGMGIIGSERADHASIEEGTKSLLRALWRSHPGILRAHRAAGRQVVTP